MSLQTCEILKGALVHCTAQQTGDGIIFDIHDDTSVDVVFGCGTIMQYCPRDQLTGSELWTARPGQATREAIRIALLHAATLENERLAVKHSRRSRD